MFSRELYEEVTVGTGGIALMLSEVSVSTLSTTWNHSAWIRIDLQWRKKGFCCSETTSMDHESCLWSYCSALCVGELIQAFTISWWNGFRQYTTLERTVWIWECSCYMYFLEVHVTHHFVYWTYELRKYTDRMEENYFWWKLISRTKANLQNSWNIRPAKYKCFTVIAKLL